MGKYRGTSKDLKIVNHLITGILKKSIYVPVDYEFYNNVPEREKFRRTLLWLREIDDLGHRRLGYDMVLDAFAGVGVLTTLYLYFGYEVIAIEKDPVLVSALWKNVRNFSANASIILDDNLNVLPQFETNDSRIKIIDLDPYDSCVSQIKEAARILKEGFLFVTVGDMYAGARFRKWSFTKKRYGIEFSGPAKSAG